MVLQVAVYNHWTGLVDWDWWTDTKNHFTVSNKLWREQKLYVKDLMEQHPVLFFTLPPGNRD